MPLLRERVNGRRQCVDPAQRAVARGGPPHRLDKAWLQGINIVQAHCQQSLFRVGFYAPPHLPSFGACTSAGYELKDHLRISRRQLSRYGERQVDRKAPILGFAHSDRTRAEAEEARIEALQKTNIPKMKHVFFDYDVELRVLHYERPARYPTHFITRRRRHDPTHPALSTHPRIT